MAKRDDELSGKSGVSKKVLEIAADVEKGFTDQRNRVDEIMDYWDAYNCELGPKQFYDGNSKIFVPLIKDAVTARKTRFVNQMFPQSQRNVEVTTENGDIPHATMALLEHYVRRTQLRTRIMPALVINGDVEGQYSLYVGWKTLKRNTVKRVEKEITSSDGAGIGESVDDIEEEEYEEGMPDISIIPDADLLILPITVDTVDDAIEAGGSVTILRRWSKAKIRDLIKSKDLDKSKGESLLENMNKVSAGNEEKKDTAKELAEAAGIKGKGKHALVYEIWTKMKVEGEYTLCRIYFGGQDQVLSVKRCPYWCDQVPVITAPAEKVANVAKGRSQIADVIDLQIFANDQVNEGADTAHFSAMPIIMTDPEKNPRVGSMILGLASIWETNPNDTKFAQFPELWKSAFERVAECKNQIFQSLGVNPSMIPQGGGRKKMSQAEVANEQQVDILTTADAVTVLEEGILTPLLQRMAEYDHQFRDKPLTVRQYGEVGVRAVMQDVEPIQMNRRFEFRWFGVEAARNAAQVQQQIAMANVFKEVPPQMYAGYRLDLAPLMVQLAENAFGPRLAPLVFKSIKDELSVPPEMENQLLMQGMDVEVHPTDEDPQHLEAHMQLLQGGDEHGVIRAHIMKHQQQMQMKVQAQAQAMQGGPGGGGGGEGPQAGAQPQPGRNMKGPPGAINHDRMASAGAPVMPRKMG